MKLLFSDLAERSLSAAPRGELELALRALRKLEEAPDQQSLSLRKIRSDRTADEDYGLWEMGINAYLRLLIRLFRDEDESQTALVVDFIDRRHD